MSFTSILAFKETAFLLAVSSAALTHALAKACSSGRMERCTCDDSPGIQHREAWQWGVCGDNLKYSTKFLKKFLGQKKVSKDLRAQVDAHNINVGIRVSVNKWAQRSRNITINVPQRNRPFALYGEIASWGIKSIIYTLATLSSISWAAILHNNYTSDTLLHHQRIQSRNPHLHILHSASQTNAPLFAAVVGLGG